MVVLVVERPRPTIATRTVAAKMMRLAAATWQH
jgi:hypothetical protein